MNYDLYCSIKGNSLKPLFDIKQDYNYVNAVKASINLIFFA